MTKSEYNGIGQRTRLTAYNGSSGNAQVTQYVYEDAVSATRLTNTIYPDSADTTSAGTDQVKTAYAVDGLPTSRTDQRGTVVSYGYDPLRPSRSQKVTNLGGSTDGTVLAITRGYDNLGRVAKITSHGNATDDPDNTASVFNQIAYTRDGLGNLLASEQSHSGVVSSSPSVQYSYDSTADSGLFTNKARQNALTYPNGRVLFSDYGAGDSLYDRLSRVQNLRETDGMGTILAQYSRTGSGGIMITDYPVPDLKQDRFGGTTGTYAALDRFGRVKDHQWYNYTSGTVDIARYLHTYDSNSNRLSTEDTVAAANSVHQDELNTFDGLNRLTGLERGELSMGSIASKNFGQDFGLDQLNNWSTFDEDPDGTGMSLLNQTRDHNAANEIEEIDTSSTYVLHDAAGNMTTVPKPGVWNAGLTLTWDAWNRLVKVEDGMNTVAEYAYDGKNRRIVKKLFVSGSFDHDEHFYLSEANQVLEVRRDASSVAWKQFTWGLRYIDDLILRTKDLDDNGSIDETLYAVQDANWDVTALAEASGDIKERFRYDPYGNNQVLDDDFTLDGDGQSDFDWEYRFTSREYDAETGLHYFRARYWHPTLGRFIGRDPLGYVDGASLYAGYFVPSRVEPSGAWVGWLPTDMYDPDNPHPFGSPTPSIPTPPPAPCSISQGIAIAGSFGVGVCQGGLDIANGVQDAGIGILNLPATVWNWTGGWMFPNIPYFPSPNWSEGVLVHPSLYPHEVNKTVGGTGATTLIGIGIAGKFGNAGNAGKTGKNACCPSSGASSYTPLEREIVDAQKYLAQLRETLRDGRKAADELYNAGKINEWEMMTAANRYIEQQIEIYDGVVRNLLGCKFPNSF